MGNSDKDFEKSNQCAFDAYCKVILRNEARDAYDQRKRKLKREQLFGEMSPEELNKLITTDRYFQFERDIVEDGLHFIVCDQGVYDALMTLPGAKRKIVLLSYFGEMNDREIGDALGTGRANVQYHRSRALAMMKVRNTDEQAKKQTRSIRNHRPRNAGRPTGIRTGYTTLQTVHTFTLPPGIHCGKRQRLHRMRQRTETATGSEADGKNPAVRYQREDIQNVTRKPKSKHDS